MSSTRDTSHPAIAPYAPAASASAAHASTAAFSPALSAKTPLASRPELSAHMRARSPSAGRDWAVAVAVGVGGAYTRPLPGGEGKPGPHVDD